MPSPRLRLRLLLSPVLVPILWCGPARAQDPAPAGPPAGSAPAPTPSAPGKALPEGSPPPALPVPSPAPAPTDAAGELGRLQGSWDCVDWVYSGQRPGHNGRIYASRYDGDRLTLLNQGREYRHGLVTLDPARTPKAMNTWDLDGPFADRTNRGIYALDGDELKVCIALDPAGARPSDFTSEVGSRRLLITYRRRRP